MVKVNYWKVLLFSCIFIINVLLRDSVVSFAFTGIQVSIVLFYLLGNKIEDAVYWHFIFMATSFAVSGIGEEAILKTGYFSTKLVGPVTLSYVIGIILLMVSYSDKKKKIPVMLFSKMQKIFVYYLIAGVLIGGLGILLSDYFVNTFVGYSVYIVVVLIHILILKNLSNLSFIKRCFDAIIPLLIASLISTIFNWIAGIRSEYSIFEMTISSPVANFSILLVLFMAGMKVKEKTIIVGLLLLYLWVLIKTGAPGKFFLNVSVVGSVYIIKRTRQKGFGVIPILGLLAVLFSFSSGLVVEDSLFSNKFNQFRSLGSVTSGSIENVGSSPYIRVASMLNIYNENLKDPVYFTLGRGYGGYFEDNLHLFAGLDLSAGAFSDDAIRLGKYPTAHSTFNLVPLFHGFIGLIILLILVYRYFERSIRSSPLSIVAVLWLLFMFYFNIQIGIIGVFLSFASEYEANLSDKKNVVLNGTVKK